MSAHTKIEWTDRTWNPWEGCTKVSPGCAHCYAAARDHRLHADAHWGKGKPRRRTSPQNWKHPLQWDTQCSAHPDYRDRVFPSLCDPFDEEVQIEDLADFFNLIRRTSHLDWLLLTKRPQNALGRIRAARNFHTCSGDADTAIWLNDWLPKAATRGHYGGKQAISDSPADPGKPPHNIWIGVSVEDQPRADARIPLLLQIPAALRFLSIEPLLGPVDIPWAFGWSAEKHAQGFKEPLASALRSLTDVVGVDWIIVGGESGAGARSCDLAWIENIAKQCAQAEVPCFVKQLGSNPVMNADGPAPRIKLSHPKGGDPAEWPPYLRVRQFPTARSS